MSNEQPIPECRPTGAITDEPYEITDEPYEITDCGGRSFVIFDAPGCRVTVNGPEALNLSRQMIAAFNTVNAPAPETQLRGKDDD